MRFSFVGKKVHEINENLVTANSLTISKYTRYNGRDISFYFYSVVCLNKYFLLLYEYSTIFGKLIFVLHQCCYVMYRLFRLSFILHSDSFIIALHNFPICFIAKAEWRVTVTDSFEIKDFQWKQVRNAESYLIRSFLKESLHFKRLHSFNLIILFIGILRSAIWLETSFVRSCLRLVTLTRHKPVHITIPRNQHA